MMESCHNINESCHTYECTQMEEALYRVVHICVKSQAPWVKLPDQASERLDYTFE